MSCRNIVQQRAREQGASDHAAGKPCNSEKYQARPGSAWDTWYRQGYEASQQAADGHTPDQ